jgi:hypothetical protein
MTLRRDFWRPLGLAAALVGAVPALAHAQDGEPTDEVGGIPAETPESMGGPVADPVDDSDKADEADAATTNLDGTSVAAKAPRPRYNKDDYPIEVILRPLTLAADQIQVSLDMPFTISDTPFLTQVFRGAYGITTDLQVGISYGFGLQTLSPASYNAGKAFSLDAAYTILPGILAAQASLPFNMDPFASGISLGVPFRLTIMDKWAVFGGQDLVQVRIYKYAPDVANPVYNEAIERGLDANSTDHYGNVNLSFGGLYQAKPNIAVTWAWAWRWDNFDDDDKPVSSFVGLTWSQNNRFDLGARAGFTRVDDPKDSFTLGLSAAYRL